MTYSRSCLSIMGSEKIIRRDCIERSVEERENHSEGLHFKKTDKTALSKCVRGRAKTEVLEVFLQGARVERECWLSLEKKEVVMILVFIISPNVNRTLFDFDRKFGLFPRSRKKFLVRSRWFAFGTTVRSVKQSPGQLR